MINRSMEEIIRRQLLESAEVKRLVGENLTNNIAEAARMTLNCYRKRGKLILFGNGGSAADAQHLAAEMVGRFRIERIALPAIALNLWTRREFKKHTLPLGISFVIWSKRN